MTFESDKKSILSKLDKSKIGEIDKEVLPLVKKINRSKDHYTTSSCAGRILIMTKAKKKNQSKRLFITHKKTNLKQVKAALKVLPEETVWFKFEPLILHIASRTIADAQEMINKGDKLRDDFEESAKEFGKKYDKYKKDPSKYNNYIYLKYLKCDERDCIYPFPSKCIWNLMNKSIVFLG